MSELVLVADRSLWWRCISNPISEHIHNAWCLRGDHGGLALSCLISNGRLPGDSTCQPWWLPVPLTSAIWADQPCSISGAQAEARAGLDPGPCGPPLALPQGMSSPCQLPTLGQRTQRTWVWPLVKATHTMHQCGGEVLSRQNLQLKPLSTFSIWTHKNIIR